MTADPVAMAVAAGNVDLISKFECQACEWTGTGSLAAVLHENARHDGAQTCWTADERTREAPMGTR